MADEEEKESQTTIPVDDSEKEKGSTENPINDLTKMTTCSGVSVTLNDDYMSHPCYVVLNGSRRKELKNMEYRINLISGMLTLSPSSFLPSIYKDNTAVKQWYKKYSPYLKHRTKWLQGVMAQAICELDLILQQASGLVALMEEAAEKQPQEIKEFYTYMYKVRESAAIVENGPEKKKAWYGGQSGGKRIQDALVMSEITCDQFDFSNCANCKHNYVLPIGPTQIEINIHNEKQKNIFRKKMTEYNTRTKSRRVDRKPKMGRMMTGRLACLYTRMNCLNCSNGVGCMMCKWACLEFKKANRKSRPYFDSNSDCKCKICACQCSVVYFCSEEKKLVQQAREDKLAELDTKPQT